jgi:hypothetical protein
MDNVETSLWPALPITTFVGAAYRMKLFNFCSQRL